MEEMGILAAALVWITCGFFIYSFPPMLFLSYAWMKRADGPDIVFKNKRDLFVTLLIGFPCAFFTYDMFNNAANSLSYLRDVVFGLELYRFFDITGIIYTTFYLKAILVCLAIAITYNIIMSKKYNKSRMSIALGAFCRIQISLMLLYTVINFAGALYYELSGSIISFSNWIICWIFFWFGSMIIAFDATVQALKGKTKPVEEK